ncbi:MFS transporter [Nocardioides sp. Kera G14]|uniref:MFS transporter n=1 Tax=Nocardioides sp. Kera G14 TaxID=2884264 RepID=UPI001D12F368|nr:MFS transporter [Nocardioides sp. Kera G14]UDY22628.1 MFS transporter [Nocardioides sp. Kera G14]
MQFVLIIWLQGIWLPLHGYDYDQTPLWAGIFLLPLSVGFLVAGPIAGSLSDRFGSRGIATSGMVLFSGTFLGLMLLPIDFPYWAFAALIFLNGIANGMFTSPNTSAIMGSVPAEHRGAASGMRATFQNSGTALSIGVFFSLMIAGLASSLPHTLTSGLVANGVDPSQAAAIGAQPPVASLFAAILGVDPIKQLVGHPVGGQDFFPHLISGPFHTGLVVVFAFGAALGLLSALASALRGAGTSGTRSTAAATVETTAERTAS